MFHGNKDMEIKNRSVNINNIQNEDIKSAENIKESNTKQTGEKTAPAFRLSAYSGADSKL